MGAGLIEKWRDALTGIAVDERELRHRLRESVRAALGGAAVPVEVEDWRGFVASSSASSGREGGGPLRVRVNTPMAARTLLKLDLLGFLEAHLQGEVELEGNLYLIPELREHLDVHVGLLRGARLFMRNTLRQGRSRSGRNVRFHYDIPQDVLNSYLDQTYRSYSCAVFEDPKTRDRGTLTRCGVGKEDSFDSLEKAQWRKFKQTLELLELGCEDTLLDIGTGYGGLLRIALSEVTPQRVVGWTHSDNQASGARSWLRDFEANRWEVNQGDYRDERRVFDRVASIGMVSHVGRGGLRSYVRRVRALVRRGGLYVHHDLMNRSEAVPLDFQVGPAFNKLYVWPGFHWFTLGKHVEELEKGGFRIRRVDDLSKHYAKTTAAWYERLCDQADVAKGSLGEPGFRAWRVFLAGTSGSLDGGGLHDYRILCEAI